MEEILSQTECIQNILQQILGFPTNLNADTKEQSRIIVNSLVWHIIA